jgi:hypothetical protein
MHDFALGAGLGCDELHADHLGGEGSHLVQRFGKFDTTGFAATARMDLCFENPRAFTSGVYLLGCCDRLFRRLGDNAPRNRDAPPLKKFLCLILVQFHRLQC